MEILDAEDYGPVHGRGGILCCFNSWKFRKLLERMGFAQVSPTPVYEDTTVCIKWGDNVIGERERAKQINIRKHFTHKVIQNGEMLLVQVPTASQLADIFTKGLHYQQWQTCVEGILGKTFKQCKGTSSLKKWVDSRKRRRSPRPRLSI